MLTAAGTDALLVLLLALAFDALLGDPPRLYRVVPHPVALIGRLIAAGEARLNHRTAARVTRALSGGALAIAVTAFAGGIGWAIAAALAAVPAGWLLEALVASTLFSFRGLYDHVSAVAAALGRSLAEARAAVAHIVGRDPESLDAAAVARAAIESTAENFSDGVVAPAFWFALLGLPGLAAYKAINTLDSMLGHRSPRYEAFGKVAARADDLMNLVPARLAGLLLVAAAGVVPGASAARAWQTMLRDAPRHRSPSAGWQEAALAGALGFGLAGPRRYGGAVVDDAWMGDGRSALTADDVAAAVRLYLAAAGLLAVLLFALWTLGRLTAAQ